ncbi:helix-turn-helix domain-containing protein [Mucilaginibacter ginsenosidivorax]|uniref:Helix-turn-helix transcriptional regulator n=1 Tax=Mucilaginibacter ginsenosidivorax TaxID=862126 RepID=A0A5B8VY87_9SPHI|nr:helix-turn-helix transcriptional regulator [Mucilaginibacter ginsenosidivorax]QEC76419.1 helix-turn-helix transcriptional regulator [Mucilaginibacter ginsenosidivorax]
MENVLKFDTIRDYNNFNNQATLHPLVSIVDLSKADPRPARRLCYNFYTVFLKQIRCGDLRYGLKNYDYEEGTLIFLAPGQAIGENHEEIYYQPQGLALVFHPDMLPGTHLGRHISDYTFFSYEVHEALHMSEEERQIVMDCFSKIEFELKRGLDKHSKKLVVANIELFLDYCIRFYDRQFLTREVAHKGIIERFETLLNDYFRSENPQKLGLPNVAYCAGKLNLSANYFGDMVKKETGKTALEFIQLKVMDLAKEKISDRDKTVNEIAYELGFKYPQHFSRLFKQRLGYTPNEFRILNN